MAKVVLPFEKPIVELLTRIHELEALEDADGTLAPDILELRKRVGDVSREVLDGLNPLQKVQLSRHAERPYTLDYLSRLTEGLVELKGDRRFAEDESIIGGLCKLRGRSVMVIGHQKGRGTKENLRRNFGMPHPEGYRKALRLFELANKFGLPVVTFIDTPGAYPGIGAEERGQSEAIGAAIASMCRARVPIISCIIGEGGSGGALALGVGNRVLVMEFGCYSVISPEGCAAILWKDGTLAGEAAKQLKITSKDLLRLGVVDEVVAEPLGGAHHDFDEAAKNLGDAIEGHLDELGKLSGEELVEQRYRRFRALGAYTTERVDPLPPPLV